MRVETGPWEGLHLGLGEPGSIFNLMYKQDGLAWQPIAIPCCASSGEDWWI